MNDALYQLYKHTNNANHLTVAHVFDDTGLFTTSAAGNDTLSGRHANMTIPKFIGALNRYRTVGTSESSYLNAASGFFDLVLKNHTYVTGGNSQDEHFHAPGRLDQYRDNVNNETCNAYNMTKLTRDLFKVTGDVKYSDFYERIHINEILASMNPETGMTTYFKPMGTGYFKAFGTPTNSFWCCTGTGMENFTRLGDSVYFHDDKDLWVTRYVSSTLNWKEPRPRPHADDGPAAHEQGDADHHRCSHGCGQHPIQKARLGCQLRHRGGGQWPDRHAHRRQGLPRREPGLAGERQDRARLARLRASLSPPGQRQRGRVHVRTAGLERGARDGGHDHDGARLDNQGDVPRWTSGHHQNSERDNQ